MDDAPGEPRSALVLGGTSDIAHAAMAAMIGRRLRTVVLAGRDPEALAGEAEALRRLGATTVEVEAFDALAPGTHEAVIDGVFDRHPHLDLVLLAFGVLGDQRLAEVDNDEALRIVSTNYVGAVSACLPVARRLRAQGHGTLVVLSSVAGERVRKARFVYGSSKAGLDGFAQGLGDWLHGSGARVMIVRPGHVKTRMTEGTPEVPFSTTAPVVADAIVAGLARGAEVVHVPAPLRLVFSALRHLPRPVFRKLPLG